MAGTLRRSPRLGMKPACRCTRRDITKMGPDKSIIHMIICCNSHHLGTIIDGNTVQSSRSPSAVPHDTFQPTEPALADLRRIIVETMSLVRQPQHHQRASTLNKWGRPQGPPRGSGILRLPVSTQWMLMGRVTGSRTRRVPAGRAFQGWRGWPPRPSWFP